MTLSKDRLQSLLEFFEDGISIDMVGGIDTGVYFSFKGSATRPLDPEQRIQHGRIVSRFGFCSECLVPTRHEFMTMKGQERFFSRCEDRRGQFQRWVDEHYAAVPAPMKV